MKENNIIIRDLTNDDIKSITELNKELGYCSNEEDVYKRLNNIMNDKNYKTLVCTVENKVIGYIGMCILYAYEYDGQYVRITSLVASKNYNNILVFINH